MPLQLRIGRRCAVALLSHMVVGCWVHQGIMCIPLSTLLLVQLGLPPMDQAVDCFVDQGTDQLVERLRIKYGSAADRLRIGHRWLVAQPTNMHRSDAPRLK